MIKNKETKTYPAEKLNILDRVFNRYKIVLVETGNETWCRWNRENWTHFKEHYNRDYALFHKVDRLTGNVVKVWKDYLDE